MKVIHTLGQNKIEKEVKEEVGFLLTNRLGDYLSLSQTPLSRYQGWFIRERGKLYKIIENLEIVGALPIKELKNCLSFIERKRANLKEKFFLPNYAHSLFYATEKPVPLELTLDIKESYDNQEFGREYQIFQEKEFIIAEFKSRKEKPIYLALRPDIFDFQKIESWIQRDYQLDRSRNSPPFKRYVYKALRLKASKIAFAVSRDKDKAEKEAKILFEKAQNLERQREEILKKIILPEKLREKEIAFAYLLAQNSLESLVVASDSDIGLFAGLPWFFQFWSRDTAISLKALASFNFPLAKEILFNLLEDIKEDGRLPNIIFGRMPLAPAESADSIGWFFKRAEDFIREEKIREKEIAEIKRSLENSIKSLLCHHTKDDFAINKPSETWMDTQPREGIRIEIQALRLNLYHLAYQLTGKKEYQTLERRLKKKIYEKFWNKKFLRDGINDPTIRPNIFLAAYIYPRLLKKKEWLSCFKNTLPKLWLKWGGIATIDKKNPSFFQHHTGEDGKSYHSGDSWFYLNNLAALILHKFDKKKFHSYIKKILTASTKEILWKGIIGHHGELSSAEKLTSEGSWVQAWSCALYIEAINKVFAKDLKNF